MHCYIIHVLPLFWITVDTTLSLTFNNAINSQVFSSLYLKIITLVRTVFTFFFFFNRAALTNFSFLSTKRSSPCSGNMDLYNTLKIQLRLLMNIHSSDLWMINNNRTNISRLRLPLILDAKSWLSVVYIGWMIEQDMWSKPVVPKVTNKSLRIYYNSCNKLIVIKLIVNWEFLLYHIFTPP